MAFNDLSAPAQEGLNYAANQLTHQVTQPDNTVTEEPIYANGRAYMDAKAEQDGLEWLGRKQAVINARRITKLWRASNAAIAAQVDALPNDEG